MLSKNLTPLPYAFEYEGKMHTCVESVMAIVMGDGNVTNFKIPYLKKEQLKVGTQMYYYMTRENGWFGRYELLTITHIRSGIVFFTSKEYDDNKTEDYFPIGCIMSAKMEPAVYRVPKHLDNEYCNFPSNGRTQIIRKSIPRTK